jgi:hypothetical protein
VTGHQSCRWPDIRRDALHLTYAHAFLDPVAASREADLMTASITRLDSFDKVLAQAYGLSGKRFVFNAWPATRLGNEPPDGEHWSWDGFERAILGALA